MNRHSTSADTETAFRVLADCAEGQSYSTKTTTLILISHDMF